MNIIETIEKDGVKYFTMPIEEAKEIVRRRNRWCDLMLLLSWKARLMDYLYLKDWPILKWFGKDIYQMYKDKYPDIKIDTAMAVVWSYPLMRKVGYADIAKKVLTITPLEKNDG